MYITYTAGNFWKPFRTFLEITFTTSQKRILLNNHSTSYFQSAVVAPLRLPLPQFPYCYAKLLQYGPWFTMIIYCCTAAVYILCTVGTALRVVRLLWTYRNTTSFKPSFTIHLLEMSSTHHSRWLRKNEHNFTILAYPAMIACITMTVRIVSNIWNSIQIKINEVSRSCDG